jgi:hypothetical protein
VKARWEFQKSYADKLIGSLEAKQNLGTMVPKSDADKIQNERQLRELKSVPDESLAKVIAKAAEIAGDAPLTAKVLKEARQQVLDPEKLEEPTAEEPACEDIEPEPEPTGPLQCVGWFKEQIRLVNEVNRNLEQVVEVPGFLSGESVIGMNRQFFLAAKWKRHHRLTWCQSRQRIRRTVPCAPLLCRCPRGNPRGRHRDRFQPRVSESQRKEVMRDPSEIRESCARKIEQVKLSDHFRAMLGCLLEQDWTTPRLVKMVLSSDGHLLGRADRQATEQVILGLSC